jgi:hypothetical protein
MRDDWVHATLERVRVPDESPTFFTDLWDEAQARERAAAKRWRRTSIVLAFVAALAISAAAVLGASAPKRAAAGVTELRAACSAQETGGLPAFSIGAKPSGKPDPSLINVKPPPGFHVDPSLWIATGSASSFGGGNVFTLSTYYSGYQLDHHVCSRTTLPIALTRKGLPAAGVHLTDPNTELVRRCLGTARFAFRIRIVTGKAGVPTSAQLAVARAKTGKLLTYYEWSPTRLDGWSVAACE